MIAFSIEKESPEIAIACMECVRKKSNGEFCINFCKLNEKLVYVCPFCNKQGTHTGMHLIDHNGIKNFKRGVICKNCGRDVIGLYDMSNLKNGLDLRIGYHTGRSIYAQANN